MLTNVAYVFSSMMIHEQGWTVKATAPIAAHTLLCEYSGRVDFSRHMILCSDDDIMDLIRSPQSKTRFDCIRSWV